MSYTWSINNIAIYIDVIGQCVEKNRLNERERHIKTGLASIFPISEYHPETAYIILFDTTTLLCTHYYQCSTTLKLSKGWKNPNIVDVGYMKGRNFVLYFFKYKNTFALKYYTSRSLFCTSVGYSVCLLCSDFISTYLHRPK